MNWHNTPKTRHLSRLTLAVATVAMTMISLSAQAALWVASSSDFSGVANTPPNASQLTTNDWSLPLSVTHTSYRGGMGTSAYAFADYGVLKTSSYAAMSGGSMVGKASGTADWADLLTITAPGLTGQQGVLHASLISKAAFNMSGTVPYDAWAKGQFQAYGLNVVDGNTRGFTGAGQVINGTFNLDIPFTFGQLTTIGAHLYSDVNPTQTYTTSSSVSNTVDLSLYWGGITGITLNGNPLSNFSISSASGTNYLVSAAPASVPVPAAAWLFGSGLLGLVGIARRRNTFH